MQPTIDNQRDKKFMPGDRVIVIESGYIDMDGMYGVVVEKPSHLPDTRCVHVKIINRATGESSKDDNWFIESENGIWPMYENEIQHAD